MGLGGQGKGTSICWGEDMAWVEEGVFDCWWNSFQPFSKTWLVWRGVLWLQIKLLFPIRYFLANVSFINWHYFQLIIFPHNLCIVDYVVAVRESLHDSSALQLAEIAKTPGKFLQPNKWLWADTACGCHPWCIVPLYTVLKERNTKETYKHWTGAIPDLSSVVGLPQAVMVSQNKGNYRISSYGVKWGTRMEGSIKSVRYLEEPSYAWLSLEYVSESLEYDSFPQYDHWNWRYVDSPICIHICMHPHMMGMTIEKERRRGGGGGGGKKAFGLDLMGRDPRNNLKFNCCSISRQNFNMITTRMYIWEHKHELGVNITTIQ